ncbi:hypothetical protein [Acinetobacter baumannii]|uniref:hypothetical protein n=1 Tax=Acinetobacter baumannii TaxID=470 RepID=UPI002941603E|nr:hypothetical protein [Acinetobacter baumannii]MDV4325463.1 hypothetical protein [Acinetobacter baumannii]
MKPEKFIRWFGIEDAKYLIEQNINCNDFEFSLDDLKRLLESLEIISDLDGIDAAKGTLAELIKLNWDEFEHRWIDNWMCTRPRLESAIKDHESIYGGGDD